MIARRAHDPIEAPRRIIEWAVLNERLETVCCGQEARAPLFGQSATLLEGERGSQQREGILGKIGINGWCKRWCSLRENTVRGLPIVGTYVENESGAKLARPELFRLIADSKPGDVLLIEQVDPSLA